jgi:hypothetical protein
MGIVFQHGIHEGQEFSHAGDENDFGRFAGLLEAISKSLDDWITTPGREGRHVQSRSTLDATTPDEAFPAMLAALSLARGATPASAAILFHFQIELAIIVSQLGE